MMQLIDLLPPEALANPAILKIVNSVKNRRLNGVRPKESSEIEKIRKSNESVKTLSLAYGVSVNTIYSILSNDNDPKRIASKRKRNAKVVKPCSPDPEY
jgi:hypothetical protein